MIFFCSCFLQKVFELGCHFLDTVGLYLLAVMDLLAVLAVFFGLLVGVFGKFF